MSDFLLVSLRDGDFGREVARRELGDFEKVITPTGARLHHLIVTDENVELPDLSEFDGVIVGGSALNVTNEEYSPYQLHADALLGQIVTGPVPVFLVCFGIGWLAQHTGGTVDRLHGETPGGTTVVLTPAAATDPLMAGLPPTFAALTGHNESAALLGDGVVHLASGPTCPVQIIRYGDTVWATQFHGELDAESMGIRMAFYKNHGYFRPEEYDDIVATLPAYDVSVAQQLLRNFIGFCTTRAANAPVAVERA